VLTTGTRIPLPEHGAKSRDAKRTYYKKKGSNMKESAVERLIKTNPNMEIWWDSSPLVFKPWVEKMVNEARRRAGGTQEQLSRLYNAIAAKASSRLHNNPPLSWCRAVRSESMGRLDRRRAQQAG
jgi:hypothetical protein